MRMTLLATIALWVCLGAHPAAAGKWVETWLYVPNAVTLSDYRLLTEGMSYRETCALLKLEGKLMSSATSGGITIAVYSWQNIDGSTLAATFQNDQLLSKAQAGLL